ncbi:hypothetical protein HanIR_Chr03g0138251 [Helianthus annuus]|nr:hypothetical protein HanIR_Chr03g0138251 [Helianthus annuus]
MRAVILRLIPSEERTVASLQNITKGSVVSYKKKSSHLICFHIHNRLRRNIGRRSK